MTRPAVWPIRLANPADREQQDRRGDRNENIVEAGDQPELFFVGDRGRALGLDKTAKRGRGVGADHARGDRIVKLLLSSTWSPPLFRRGYNSGVL